jgi:hypothetical protein
MSEDRKCPKCGTDLRLVEDKNRTSVGGCRHKRTASVEVSQPQVRIHGTRRLDGE